MNFTRNFQNDPIIQGLAIHLPNGHGATHWSLMRKAYRPASIACLQNIEADFTSFHCTLTKKGSTPSPNKPRRTTVSETTARPSASVPLRNAMRTGHNFMMGIT